MTNVSCVYVIGIIVYEAGVMLVVFDTPVCFQIFINFELINK